MNEPVSEPRVVHPPKTTVVTTVDVENDAKRRELSPNRLAVRRFLRNPPAVIGLAVLAIITLASVFAPFISPFAPDAIDLGAIRQPPSAEHWLGTDSTGRDVLSRLLSGGRVSLAVGFLAAFLAVTTGTLLGVIAGWYGGAIDAVISRVIDIMLTVPPILVVIVLAGIIGPNVTLLILVIAGLSWPGSARIARGVVLGLREQEFVQAAGVLGSKSWFVIRKHLLPGVLPPVVVAATLLVAEAVLLESALSFLGAGVQPPQSSWGNMLTEAQSLTVLSSMPWLWIPAGTVIALTVLSAMSAGDGIRDAIDPRKNR
ncbi:ABC transporter permease [Leucobacter sp. UT-8R-CII-1-4]|uniref:oligopeptide ABC transporter permease n=1 Tax=Leucobacter sp. UT-8R-CII-1-4 TaxID=3040075 RepID=UPI0024A7B8CD|nr:oligopeptide ABC transporter permease [Leucobacter sp. UT-8R-CII-1-4]MDI6023410.1 ABC transporter permease [Leucobacter sp. UT-8R-CII-1-4]